jgi:DNA polymerase elongation subunit (family B)
MMALQHSDEFRRYPEKRSRLMIDITPELRRRIKIAAAQNDQTVYEYVGNILENTVPAERTLIRRGQGLNHEAVEDLLRTSDEIMSKYPGVVFEDSAEILYQLREERLRDLEQS